VIGLLRGAVVVRTGEGEVIIDVAGVGYRVAVTPATAAALVAGPGSAADSSRSVESPRAPEATLYVHTHVREDAIVLYGFVHDDERRCFEVLLGSHGVGPALALAIMAALSPAALSTAVLEEDLDTLCTVPGVGRKTAARLLIELKSRLDLPDLSLSGAGVAGVVGAGAAAGGAASSSGGGRTSRSEARAALSELGYGPDEIRGALDGLRDDVGVEEMLRLALRELASR
jgi:Holliday junction DNA helicase RuvA